MSIAEFVASVQGARVIAAANGPTATQTATFVFENEDEELGATLALGGDPSLSVRSIDRTGDVIEDLGRALACYDEAFMIPDEHNKGPSFPANGLCAGDGWQRFSEVRDLFVELSDISEALQPPEAYANFIGIAEEPVAVLVHMLSANGCCLDCLLASETKVYSLSYGNS